MQQSDALGRRNQPDAGEENVERAERDFACSQPPELTKTGNAADRKKRQARNAGADCEFGEKARCDIAMTPKPLDGSPRAAGKELELEHPNNRRKGSRGRPAKREPRNRRNVGVAQDRERRKSHHSPDEIVQERGAPTAPREKGEAPHVLHQQEWQRDRRRC